MLQEVSVIAAVVIVVVLGFSLIFMQSDDLPSGTQVVELVSPQDTVVASRTCELQEECAIEGFSEALMRACGSNWTLRVKAAEAFVSSQISAESYWNALLSAEGKVFSACNGVSVVSDNATLHICGDSSALGNITIVSKQVRDGVVIVIDGKEWLCSEGVFVREE